MKRLLFTTLLISFSLICFAQKGKWKKAQKTNTIESYKDFITTYPDSEYTDLATNKMETLITLEDWNLAVKNDDINAYQEFLKHHGNSSYASEARSKIENLTWQLAVRINSYEAYEAYLKSYPKSSKAKEAEKKLAGLQAEKAGDSFKILKVLVTDEEQTFQSGYALGANSLKPQYEVGTPIKGEVFVIIDWSLGDFIVKGEKLSISQSKLLLLEEGEESQVGYARQLTASPSDKIVWTGAKGSTYTYPIGRSPSGKRLFVVKRKNLDSLILKFMDEVYPISTHK